jgi:hypothetical protein
MTSPAHLLLCVVPSDAEDLQVLKVYRRPPDADAAADPKGFVRVIDDSGEDYLYPETLFLPLPLPLPLEQQIESLARTLAHG